MRQINSHPLLSISIIFNFFQRIGIYNKIINKIESNRVFIDRNNEEGNNYLVNEFKKKNKKNKVYSYSLNGLALNNDLIYSHYLYSNVDYLFCYGKFDKMFIQELFNKNKFKLLNIPLKIIPVGSVRNFSHKIRKKQKSKIFNKEFKFLYIKSNSFIYNGLDAKCFKKFCIFIVKNFSKSLVLVKEKDNHTSKINEDLISKRLIFKENIFTSNKIKPEDMFSKVDFVVGTTSAALAQAIYFDKPVICLDDKIIISSFLKFFCSIYISPINKIESYKNEIFNLAKKKFTKSKIKNFIFEKTKENPYIKIVKEIKL